MPHHPTYNFPAGHRWFYFYKTDNTVSILLAKIDLCWRVVKSKSSGSRQSLTNWVTWARHLTFIILNTGVGSYSLLQGIFPSQGLNPGLPHCMQILYQLSHQGSPRILQWVDPFSRGSSSPRNETRVSCIAGGFFTSWATREPYTSYMWSQTLFSAPAIYWNAFQD